ncbi:unnamed protein product [Symbiodinium natans]|uniref:Uncharacterized protein n=1 Tax=Symbiodinium natans TaxID=878477 RepID=A0A812U606_9DINO|nr:unnamed protein product [Symbiodinium natans]
MLLIAKGLSRTLGTRVAGDSRAGLQRAASTRLPVPAEDGALLTALNQAAEAGNVQSARDIFERLQDKSKRRDGRLHRMVWNTLLKAFANAGDAHGAKFIFRDMERHLVAPNMQTYGKLMEAAAKSADAAPLSRRFVGTRSAEDDIQTLLDECDRVERNWDALDRGRVHNGATGSDKVPRPKAPQRRPPMPDMLSWALARQQAMEQEEDQKQHQFLSAESATLADALHEAQQALADAKLRLRAKEATERERIRARLDEEIPSRRRTSRDTAEPAAAGAAPSGPADLPEVGGPEVSPPLRPRPPPGRPEVERPAPHISALRPESTCRPAQQWKVVGGVGKGGIIVRSDQDLQSEQLEERLATGSLVEQEELIGDRLRFWRLTGSGPKTGWVSIKLAQKDLMVKVLPEKSPQWHGFTPVPPPGPKPRRRSTSAQGHRPSASLPRLPQPRSAPPPRAHMASHSSEIHLPPLPR